jgi:hypothetical protein
VLFCCCEDEVVGHLRRGILRAFTSWTSSVGGYADADADAPPSVSFHLRTPLVKSQ